LGTREPYEARRRLHRALAQLDIEFTAWKAAVSDSTPLPLWADQEDPRDALIGVLEDMLAMSEENRRRDVEAIRLEAEIRERELLAQHIKAGQRHQDVIGKATAQVADLRERVETLSKAQPATAGLQEILRQVTAIHAALPTMYKMRYSERLLSEHLQDFLAAKEKEIGETKHLTTYPAKIAVFLDIVGDKPVRDYVRADIEKFRDTMDMMPANATKHRIFMRLSLAEAAKKNAGLAKPHPVVTPKTVDDAYLAQVRGLFNWLERQGHIEANPARNISSLRKREEAAAAAKRVPFDAADVNAILALFAREPKVSADRWLPVMALLTGAKLNELCQLRVEDIVIFNGLPHFNITNEPSPEDDDEDRKLKTAQSKRKIPVHPQLAAMGFLDFVAQRTKGRLFPDLTPDKWGYLSSKPSKRFQYALRKTLEISDERKTFYSFRHLYKDLMRTAKVPERAQRLAMGHAMSGVADAYGSPDLLPEESRELAGLSLPAEIDLGPYLRRRR
jgi:integrase